MKERKSGEILRCGCLDLVEASYRHRLYPLMYCHMELDGCLDIDRLKRAVSLSGEIVPEIFLTYQFQAGCFTDKGYTANEVVITEAAASACLLRPDLSRSPQLRIIITPHRQCEGVVVIMSHILADGIGFLQYLYLLAAIYSGEKTAMERKNMRDIRPFLKNIRVFGATDQTRAHRRVSMLPLMRASGKRSSFFCLRTELPGDHMRTVRQKARRSKATLNDVFMTAYARVTARMQSTDTVLLSCPADLRRFYPESDILTVANMTGIYRKVAVEIPEGCTFAGTLQQIHTEMTLQKSRNRCFSGIKALYRFHRLPYPILGSIIKLAYRPSFVSYTNIGVIDETKLCFGTLEVRTCFFTGTYRLPPDFQLTVSTFKNVCTLNCTLFGSADAEKRGQHILEQVKQEILDWLEE